MAVKRYAIYRPKARRGMGGPLQKKVVEVEEGSQPFGAVEVAAETALHDWTDVEAYDGPAQEGN